MFCYIQTIYRSLNSNRCFLPLQNFALHVVEVLAADGAHMVQQIISNVQNISKIVI